MRGSGVAKKKSSAAVHVVALRWTENGVEHTQFYGPVEVPNDPMALDRLVDSHVEAWRSEHPDTPIPHASIAGLAAPVEDGS